MVLPHLLLAFRGTPHASTGKTSNMLMLGREFQLPDFMMNDLLPIDYQARASMYKRWPNA